MMACFCELLFARPSKPVTPRQSASSLIFASMNAETDSVASYDSRGCLSCPQRDPPIPEAGAIFDARERHRMIRRNVLAGRDIVS